jgi:hypothetical protein
MTVKTQARRTGAHVISEANGMRSRETGFVAEGGVYEPGTVMGRIAIGNVASAAKSGGNTGNGTLTLDATTPALANAMVGVYRVRFTEATKFTVENPDGVVIGSGANGAAFADGVKFTTAAGGNAFVAGDGFDITVNLGSEMFAGLDLDAVDGSQIAAAVLWDHVDASDDDVRAVFHVGDCEVNDLELVWPDGISGPQKAVAISQLKKAGIIVR